MTWPVFGLLLSGYWLMGVVQLTRRSRHELRRPSDYLLAAIAAWFWPLFRR
jgi:hypothetical protein